MVCTPKLSTFLYDQSSSKSHGPVSSRRRRRLEVYLKSSSSPSLYKNEVNRSVIAQLHPSATIPPTEYKQVNVLRASVSIMNEKRNRVLYERIDRKFSAQKKNIVVVGSLIGKL